MLNTNRDRIVAAIHICQSSAKLLCVACAFAMAEEIDAFGAETKLTGFFVCFDSWHAIQISVTVA